MSFENHQELETIPSQERSPKYLGTLTKIEAVLSEGDRETRRKYIDSRLEDLSLGATSGELSHVGTGIHHGFLGPKMEIRRSLFVDPLVVDDPKLYESLFDTIDMLRSYESLKNKSLREIIPLAVQWSLSQYFGNITASGSTEGKNRQFYLDRSTSESTSISISELRDKGIAVCAEKGAASQNILAFVGLESDLIASTKCRIPADSDEGAHYFILIHAPKAKMIYNPTNPQVTLDTEGNIVSYAPAMYPITVEQSADLLAGGNLTVEYVDFEKNADGIVNKLQKRTYAGPRVN